MDVFRLVCPPLPPVLRGCAPPNRKQKHCVFLKSWALCPLLSQGFTLKCQNAVNEFAGLCTLEQLAHQAAPHKDAPGGMSQRLPEQPQNGSDEPNIPGISFHPNLSWSWPWLATHLLDLARGGLHRPPAKIANRPPRCALATCFEVLLGADLKPPQGPPLLLGVENLLSHNYPC